MALLSLPVGPCVDGRDQPGKPDQNTFIEGFDRSYREEVLEAYVFESPSQVQALTDD
jgi:putative transposase